MAAPSILNTVKDLDRLRQIVAVLTKHGFGEVVTRTGLGSLLPGAKKRAEKPKIRLGERIRLVLQDLGPSFVKLGQIVSTRPDIIPADIVEELKKLQDEVPPEPFEAIQPMIEGELGASDESKIMGTPLMIGRVICDDLYIQQIGNQIC